MVDVADNDGTVMRLDAVGLDSWLTRVGRTAEGIATLMGKPPEGASTVVGKDARLTGGRRLGLRHDAAMYRGGELGTEIADLVRRLRANGSRVINEHASTDADNADGVGRAGD